MREAGLSALFPVQSTPASKQVTTSNFSFTRHPRGLVNDTNNIIVCLS